MAGADGPTGRRGAAPVEVAPARSPAATRPRRERRRRRIVWRAAVVATAVLFVAGTVTAVVTYVHVDGPGQVVDSYFAALHDGDAPRALKYGRPPTGETGWLTSAVLEQQQRLAPTSVVSVLDVQTSGGAATVRVSFSIGDATPVTQSLRLHKTDRHWLLDTATAVVRVDPGIARNRATLAGRQVPDGPVALFPGAVPIIYDTDLMTQAPASDRVTFTSAGVLKVTPELTDQATDTVQDSVKQAMSQCLAAGADADATCPMTPTGQRAVPGSLRGQLTSLDLAGAVTLISSDPDGLVEMAGTMNVIGSWATLDFNNQAVNQKGTATVPVTARLYISRPADVAWVTS